MNEELPSAALTALEQGNKIEAIKYVREAKGLGLKEAKDLVDAYVAKNPSLQQRLAAIQSEQNGKLMKWLFVIAVIAAVVYYLSNAS